MAVGISLFPQGVSYSTAVTLGKLAEEKGFDGIFVVEAGASNDAMAMAQAIAMRTQRASARLSRSSATRFWLCQSIACHSSAGP